MPKPSSFKSFFIFLFSVFGSLATAQINTGYELISTAQGLSQGLINDMIQDRDGFIWIATKGGLNRYDGYTFKVYTTDPQDTSSISSNTLSNLLEDSMGRIWVGTYDAGVNMFDKKNGRFLRIRHEAGNVYGLSGDRIVSGMIELPGGRILVCAQGAGLNIISLSGTLNPKSSVTRLMVPGNRMVSGISKDEKGFIWVGCTDASIFIFNPASESFELLSDGLTFTSLIENTGKLLTARSSQSEIVNRANIPELALLDSAGNLNPRIISYDKKGAMMLAGSVPLRQGANGSNFYDFSGMKKGSPVKGFRGLSLSPVFTNQAIKCILVDRSGVLWLGMLGQGIYKYRIGEDRFKAIFPTMSAQRITVLNNDIVFVLGWRYARGISSGGIESSNPLKALTGKSTAINVIQTQNGEYWAYPLAGNKLARYTAGQKMIRIYDEPVNFEPTEQLQPLMEDSRHRVWVCGANGSMAMVEPTTGKLSRFVIDVEQQNISQGIVQTSAFYEDKTGVYWLGTEHGFARLVFNDSSATPDVRWFKNLPGISNSLSYNYVSWFMDDPVDDDFLWISTKGGGLNRMQKSTGKFIHYTTKHGLPNDVVYGTLTDNAGNIWGSTNRGLFCMVAATGPKKDSTMPVFRVFSTSDGLQADEFNTNAFGKLSNGHLVFGGVNGVNVFDPQKILDSSFKPNVFITGILLGNKLLTPGDNTGVLKETIEKSDAITLNYLQDVVTLEFSSLDFRAPLQNKYRYQLAGIDEDWVESGTRRTATYLHLPAGDYTFRVQGSNSQGIWSDHIASLNIKVLPPWWRSWWAYLIYALLTAFAISGYLRFNVNKAKLRSQLAYEQLEAKRVKELDLVKTQLYTNITHEFRTPLTVILGMAKQVMEKPAEQFQTRMEMIVRNGRSLLHLVNELLDLSKLETGNMQLQLSHGDVIYFLRYVVESFHSLAESQQKQLHFLTDIDALYIEYDREKLKQIVSNLLSNAIKFTPEKGNIYINVIENVPAAESEKFILVIKVKDTGIGIPEDKLHYVFDRFYQLDNSHTRKMDGTGIGLALTKELVKLMDGEIFVKSPPAGSLKGSEFTVSIPLRKVAPVAENMPGVLMNVRKPVPETIHIQSAVTVLPAEKQDINIPLILLVEDNADVVAYTASCLSEYRLAVGKDGREGFEIATEMIPDLIISDVMMPFLDGFELLTKLRQDKNTSHIPVIMLTAKADIGSKIQGLQHGADAYLEKPFNKDELQVRIRKLLEMRRNLQQYYLEKAGILSEKLNEPVIIPDKITDHSIEDAFVKKVREAVEQNLSDINFSVQKLSRLVFMSHSQLHRKLDALTGCSPNKFIRMIRLKKAKTLLRDPTDSIASIAMDCGYNDPGYFARVFKQEFGVTPQEWRTANVAIQR